MSHAKVSIRKTSYCYKDQLYNLTRFALENNLYQTVEFCTWSRIINGVKKESLLDHVYVNNLSAIKDVHMIEPVFGDHVLTIVELHSNVENLINVKANRNWKGYSKIKMNDLVSIKLGSTCWDDLNVQDHWNLLENEIVNIVDYLAPIEYYSHDLSKNFKNKTPKNLKRLINLRKRLLRHDRINFSTYNAPRIKVLSKEI